MYFPYVPPDTQELRQFNYEDEWSCNPGIISRRNGWILLNLNPSLRSNNPKFHYGEWGVIIAGSIADLSATCTRRHNRKVVASFGRRRESQINVRDRPVRHKSRKEIDERMREFITLSPFTLNSDLIQLEVFSSIRRGKWNYFVIIPRHIRGGKMETLFNYSPALRNFHSFQMQRRCSGRINSMSICREISVVASLFPGIRLREHLTFSRRQRRLTG